MSTSIPVVNRNQTLPPLLLPDLRFLNERQYQKISLGAPDQSSLKRFNTLESLANVATKRLKLSNQMVTPPPTAPVSTTISPSPSYVTFQESPDSSVKSVSPSPSPSSSSSTRVEKKPTTALNTVKRQRIGPSCDGCRLKKIKCDASIEILLQDESIITSFSSELHHVFSRQEILDHSDTLFEKLGLPESILEETADDDTAEAQKKPILIKHIDKIVLFKPCTSCRKRRASNGQNNDCCVFSKGFTRADINVFSKISSRVQGKMMAQMDITDYRNAGF